MAQQPEPRPLLLDDAGHPQPDEIRRAAELTRLLARARLLPAGAHTRDVGAYRALEVQVRGPG